MSAVGLLVVGGSGDDLREHGSHDARGIERRGTVRNFFWQNDGIRASRSSVSQDTAGARRRDNGVVDDAVPDLVRCPRDGPHPRRGRARRGQGRARGGPGGYQRRRVRVRRRAGKPAGEHRGHRRGGHRRARTRRPSADSRSSTCPHARRRCSGLPRSPSPAAARKRSGRSGPTPNSTRCSARLMADGDVPTASDRRRPAALEQDLPWRRPDNADLRIDLSRGRGPAPLGPDVKPGPRG